MDDPNRISTGTAFLLAVTIVLGAVGDLLLSTGMKQIGSIEPGAAAAILHDFLRIVTNANIWLGIAALLAMFVLSLLLLSRLDYSYIQPASAVGYALVALLGYAVLGEVVTLWRWAGIACICAGVSLVGRTPPRTV